MGNQKMTRVPPLAEGEVPNTKTRRKFRLIVRNPEQEVVKKKKSMKMVWGGIYDEIPEWKNRLKL